MKKHIISKLNELSSLFVGFLLCAALLTMRMKVTESFQYLFLVWNLFLAFIPYGITFILKSQEKWQRSWWTLTPILGLWLLFLPNTPYLISDLQHIYHAPREMVWYDAMLLFVFAIYSLCIMTLTIQEMRGILSKKIPVKWIPIVIASVFILCGFGIYLGRFLRWNSWDIIQNPMTLFEDIVMRIRHPFTYAKTWVVTFGYAGITSLFYVWYTSLIKTKDS